MVYYKISRRKKVIYGIHEDLGILLERYPDVFTGVFVLTQYCQSHEKRDAWLGNLTFLSVSSARSIITFESSYLESSYFSAKYKAHYGTLGAVLFGKMNLKCRLIVLVWQLMHFCSANTRKMSIAFAVLNASLFNYPNWIFDMFHHNKSAFRWNKIYCEFRCTMPDFCL